ncbi:unnamed protein product [Tilletia controversa]|nr:unnamed protein product [Tilletia controversa]
MIQPSSPTLSVSSASSRRSTASTLSRRGPPPQPPQKPFHLTVRSKVSPYDAALASASPSPSPSQSPQQTGAGISHSHWDSQATIRGAPPQASASASAAPSAANTLRPNHTGVSVAESFFSSYSNNMHSREPSLLLPDETGMGSAGFAIASSPSAFLHQHNAHAIASATAAAAAPPAPPSPPAPVPAAPAPVEMMKPLNLDDDEGEGEDEGSSDGIEDIDSFLGDDTPQQSIVSPKRVTKVYSTPTSPIDSGPPQAAMPSPPLPPPPAAVPQAQAQAYAQPEPFVIASVIAPGPPPPPPPPPPPAIQPDPPVQVQRIESPVQEVKQHPIPISPPAPSSSTPSHAKNRSSHPPPIPPGFPARALYEFQGEPNSNELSLAAGQAFEVLDPNLAVGWSLAVVRAADGIPDQRGLVPNGCAAPAPALPNPFANLFRISRASIAAGMAYPTPVANHAIPEEEPEHEREHTHQPRSPHQSAEGTQQQGKEKEEDDDDRFQAWLKGAASNDRYEAGSLGSPNGNQTGSADVSMDTTASSEHSRHGTFKAGQAPLAAIPESPNRTSTGSTSARIDNNALHGTPSMRKKLSAARLSDSSSASPLLVPSYNTIEIRPPAPIEPLSASTNAIATTNAAAVPSRPGYLANLLSFGGKSFNRFGPFVASGAEDWILCTEAGAGIEAPSAADSSLENDAEGEDGAEGYGATWGRGTQRSMHDLSALTLSSLSRSARRSKGEITQHMVISGPAGPRWKPRSPAFHVAVHSPIKKKKMNGMSEYTLYTVTSTYPALDDVLSSQRRQRNGSSSRRTASGASEDPEMEYAMPYDPTLLPDPAGHTLTVLRRFTHFAWLARVLSAKYPALVLPPLPSKQYAGRFSSEFIETRRADLDLWLARVVRHPVARYEEALIFFLSEEEEGEWKRREGELEAVPKVEIVSGIGPTGAYSTVGRKGLPVTLGNGYPSLGGKAGSSSSSGATTAGVKSVVVLEGAPTFFASTFHPDFNLDVGDAASEARAMERFADAYERAMLLEPGGGLSGALSGHGSAGGRSASGSGGGGGGGGASGGGGGGGGWSSTVGSSASAIADSAGPNAVPPRGYPAAGAMGVLPAWRGLRESTALGANSYRDLSFALLRLVTGRGLGLADDQPPAPGSGVGGGAGGAAAGASAGGSGGGGPRTPDLRSQRDNHWVHGPPMGGLGKRPATGASNEEGGWCWREGCTECVALTKSLQYMAQSLQSVADEYEEHTRTSLMRQHERLKAIGRPRLSIDKLLDVHHSTTAKYREATGEAVEDGTDNKNAGNSSSLAHLTQTERELMAARCETVLNVTMSEMDRVHQERTEDWTAWGKHWLDEEIEHYEKCLETLKNARAAFEPDSWEFYAREGPVLPTPYDSELYATRRSAFPIPMPSGPYAPPGMTAAALRPVSLATEVVREGVTKFTYLFGSSSSSTASGSSPVPPPLGGGGGEGGYMSAADARRELAGAGGGGGYKGSPLMAPAAPAGGYSGGGGGASGPALNAAINGPTSPYYNEQTTRGLYVRPGGGGAGADGNAVPPGAVAPGTPGGSVAWPGADQLLTLRAGQQQQQQQQAWYDPESYGKMGGGRGAGGGGGGPGPPPLRHHAHAPSVPAASSIFASWR